MTGEQGFRRFRPRLVSLAVASCFATGTALANPTNPTVVHGAANFANPAANVLNVTTATPKTIINWGSFSINANELTKFLQPSAASAVLNRVAAGNPSAILGALQSNGRVLLVNPSGIMFGAGAQIDVAGLVATTLNLSNADFLADRMRFTEVPGAGSVVNQGNITTPQGGNVYLVGPAVTNNGIITSPKGEVVLAAGNSVELVNPGTPNLRVEITAPDNEARNLGQIVVESGRAGIYAGLINNSGSIRADSVVEEGGRILLKGTKSVTLEGSSVLSARGAGGGVIEVLAKDGGTVNVAGRLDASAPNGGNGGFIETSADRVKVASGTRVTTAAPFGKTGMWLIDPPYSYIIAASGGDITGADLSINLGGVDPEFPGTNITITSDQGTGVAFGGNIEVNDIVSWNSSNSLTLIARNNVDVNSKIKNTGSGGLNVYAGWNGDSTTEPAVTPFVGWIYLPAPIEMNQSTGKVVLVAGGEIAQHVGSGEHIIANELVAYSAAREVRLNDVGNSVNVLAGRSANEFKFRNSRSLTIGNIDTLNTSLPVSGIISGITVDGAEGTAALLDVAVTGNLSVVNNVRATGGFNSGVPGGTATLNLSATGTLGASGATISAVGGNSTTWGNASATLSGGLGVELASETYVYADANNGSSGGNAASTIITSASGNVNLGASAVNSYANYVSGIATTSITAPNGAITSTESGGVGAHGSNGSVVALTAMNGIGTPGAPIYIGNSFSTVTATNGPSGDIALQFSGNVDINTSSNLSNANPTGTYYIQANESEGSSIDLSVPFLPGGALQAGQKVHFRATDFGNGNISLSGPESGEISGAGQVTLEAGSSISMHSSTSISATNVLLKANQMDIQGTVTATNNIFVTPFTAGTPIELGGSFIDGALALSSATLGNLFGLGLGIGSDGTTANTGSITVTAAVGPFNAFPNFFGMSFTQGTLAPINSPAGLNAFTSGDILLNHPGNNIGSFGGQAGTSINVITTGNLALGAVTAGSSASFTSSGGAILNPSGLANITSPTVSLTAATGIGDGIPIMLTNASPAGVTAVNSTSGGIGLLQTNGTFTVGSGGWNVQNAPGGEIIIEGMNVTLGAGAPNSGPLEIFATNEAIVGPAGYASTNPVLLVGGNKVNVNGSLSAGDLILIGGNEVNINGVTAQGNTASVVAGKLNVNGGSTPAQLIATTDLGVIAGEVNVTGGTGPGAFAEIKAGPGSFFMETLVLAGTSGSTTGNINLTGGSGAGAYARIFGDPDVGSLLVPVAVGGVINMVAGSGAGAYARIESASPNSIFVDFTNLTTGGFFVNGVENAVSSGDSGFFAGGQPAVPGQNLHVTYGGAPLVLSGQLPASVEQVINQIVASTNQQTELVGGDVSQDAEGGNTGGDLKDEKDKKSLPVCGK